MKKITKILALTLALITLALSCTSCGNLFISKEEKQEMARNIENYSTILCRGREVTNKENEFGPRFPDYIKDTTLFEYGLVKCITQSDKMSVTFVLNGLRGNAIGNDGIPTEEVISFSIPYEIKSAVSPLAIETIISEDRKTVTIIYSSEGKEVNSLGEYRIYDEIVIKYKK